VGLIYESAQVVRRAVLMGGRKKVDTIVAPAEFSRKIGDRHHLDHANSNASKLRQFFGRGAPRSFGCECADVHFVNDLAFEFLAEPLRIGPPKLRWIHHHRRIMRPTRLIARCGIWVKMLGVVQAKSVKCASAAFNRAGKISTLFAHQRVKFATRVAGRTFFQNEIELHCFRRPNPKMCLATADYFRADCVASRNFSFHLQSDDQNSPNLRRELQHYATRTFIGRSEIVVDGGDSGTGWDKMNGKEIRIEFFKPLDEAFALTKKILFQPFDFTKWCVIGFAAFLAHLGAGFNFRYNYNRNSNWRDIPRLRNFADWLASIPHPVVVFGAAVLFVIALALTIIFTWLRARGRLIFIDCVAKNRAAIVEPWREFRQQGNSYFLFSLLVGCGFLLVAALLSLPFMLPIVRGVTFLHLHDFYLISMIALWGMIILLAVCAWILIGHIMVPVMYRRRCRAGESLRRAISLINSYPGEITLYCLFWIALAIGVGVIACAATCLTCCVAAIPYVGTVILLPVYVCLRAFGLLFLRQFGADYDVWAGITPPNELSPAQVPPPLPSEA